MFSSFFALLKSSAGLFRGFTPPAARQAPVVFFICQIPLRFCTSIWKEPFRQINLRQDYYKYDIDMELYNSSIFRNKYIFF